MQTSQNELLGSLKSLLFRLSDLSGAAENCRPEPILPFGDILSASVGELFSMYCASREATDILSWRFPNGTDIPTDPKAVRLPQYFMKLLLIYGVL